jgi:hypothetical protein
LTGPNNPVSNWRPPRSGVPKWIRYEAQSWLVLALRLEPLAELAHRRLADLCWSGAGGDLDAGPKTAELCKVPRSRWPGVLRQLRQAGWRVGNGPLSHPAVVRALAEARQFQRDRHRATASATAARWPAPPPPDSRGARAGKTPASRTPSCTTDEPASCTPTVNVTGTAHDNTQRGQDAEALTLSPEPPQKSAAGEGRFMADLVEVFAACGPKVQETELSQRPPAKPEACKL